jgi:hypothetical protein
LDLPALHRVPLGWFLEAASVPIQLRVLEEFAPHRLLDPVFADRIRQAVESFRPAAAVARKQRPDGVWGGTMLAPVVSRSLGLKEVGSVYQYRRLLEHGWSKEHRVFKQADRVLFRLLSRDEDPKLLFEYQRPAKGDPAFALWARELLRQGSATALARGGHSEDPRLRGAGHRILNDVSMWLRSEEAEKPFIRKGGKTVLPQQAHPPTIFAVEMLAFLPNLQRERAGFVERLGHYLAQPGPKREWFLAAGGKQVKPQFHLLGDPLELAAGGHPKDIPFALYWLELLARLGILRATPGAHKAAVRLFSETEANGVWSPKNLRAQPKPVNPLSSHCFPLEEPGRSPAQRQTDVTFRLALLAKLLGIPLEVIE